MRKKHVLFINIILLAWFSLDMIGIEFENTYLVTQSWREDGIFFIIFLGSLLLFVFKEKIGQTILTLWLGIWLSTQFIFHEFYTLFGGREGLKRYFAGSLQWIHSDKRYFPDVYHTILHILILASLIAMISYLKRKKISMTK